MLLWLNTSASSRPEEERRGDRDRREHEGPERHGDERAADRGIRQCPHEVVEPDEDLPARKQLLARLGREGALAGVAVDRAGLGVGHRVGDRVVLEGRDVQVALLAVLRADRPVVGVVAVGDGERLDLVAAAEDLGEGQRVPAVDGDGLAALHRDVVGGMQRLGVRAEARLAVRGIGDEQAQHADALDDRDVEGRRVIDPDERGPHERRDRLVLAAVVAGAVVREADVGGIEEGEDLEDDEQDDARRQVLRGDLLAREVDPVDEERDRDHEAEHEPLAVQQQDGDRVQRDRIDDGEHRDLEDDPAGAAGGGIREARRLALLLGGRRRLLGRSPRWCRSYVVLVVRAGRDGCWAPAPAGMSRPCGHGGVT